MGIQHHPMRPPQPYHQPFNYLPIPTINDNEQKKDENNTDKAPQQYASYDPSMQPSPYTPYPSYSYQNPYHQYYQSPYGQYPYYPQYQVPMTRDPRDDLEQLTRSTQRQIEYHEMCANQLKKSLEQYISTQSKWKNEDENQNEEPQTIKTTNMNQEEEEEEKQTK